MKGMNKTISLSDKEEVKSEAVADITDTDIPKDSTVKEDDIKTENSVVKKKFNLKFVLFPLGGVLILIGIAAFYYFGIYKLKPKSPSEVISFTGNYIASENPTKTFSTDFPLLSNPSEPKTEESPLNGLLFTQKEMNILKSRRPVAVMINNHSEARPQSGLSSADIVIEANAEGGITRYLAIFWSQAPQKVGSIRSLRQYYLEWLSEYDPILIHDGCASTDNPLTDACGNLYTYGTKDIATLGAWRYNDGVRVSPHNEYSSITNAWLYAEKVNWDSFPSIGEWKFKKDANLADRGEKTVVETVFHARLNNSGLYDATWTYDKTSNNYFREIGGDIDIDQETDTQVTAKNIVIQQVNMKLSGDNDSRVIITTIGEGEAVILQDGKIINGTWKKASRTDRTKYYDSQGNQIQFNRGRIWIAAIPESTGQFNIIEQ